ncbi:MULTISPECIES: DEAD/DEAH box helicase [Enterococcus]|uniref:DEAD/DEAH box helicase n=1 Tax=Enterococcus TaxID=1350 RepID=UPI00189B5E46|nr:DEAD/DEAH box helicase family protein [Enterococcus mundtii]MBO1084961.1 restriction endonuclease [Enterococcus mundtii]MDV7743783.1 DEAD/DEAH box helicase family protein [Enterococcus mundtii]
MNITTMIAPKREIKPTIYAYITPTNTAKEGWIKIGYTDRDSDKRIWEQTHTVGIEPKKLWAHEARFNGGGYFSDRDFHAFLRKNGVRRNKGTEWFFFNGHPEKALALYREFVFKDYSKVQKEQQLTYRLRDEQEAAVEQTLEYAEEHPSGEFLWNAKPRFGKTLASYDLVRKLEALNVLIVTNRPAIANSWFDDFTKFIAWQTEYKFVSESDSLKDRAPMSRKEFLDYAVDHDNTKQIAFLSLQDLKGSLYFGGGYDKLKWVADTDWDILIIDEAHEGVDTFKTDIAFEKIKRQFTLHLSGTPFKAIAKGSFADEQIFNWSYEDEQAAKDSWTGEENNPYENLPQLNMFTYQMSQMITDEVNQGMTLEDGNNLDFAFDLNEFFATKDNGRFIHEADVKKWLDTLTHNEKYPFSTPELRSELKHTFWLLNRVASAKALQTLLKTHPVFENYEIILAAGDGKAEGEDTAENEKSLAKVQKAIKTYDKTITLSVGQLTTGVTIPEWTAVMMLSNLKSPALYMQAAFRAQNSNVWTETVNGEEVRYQKQNAYVFDFAPERTLIIFDEFANNLSTHTASGGGTTKDREKNIRRLLNFFPVIGEDSEGQMMELDAAQVLKIPKAIKAAEVVKRGFMSNLLFANIAGIFQAPQVALDILDNMEYVSQGKVTKPEDKAPIDTKKIKVDQDGQAMFEPEVVINKSNVIFGKKQYKTEKLQVIVAEKVKPIADKKSASQFSTTISKTVVEEMFKPQLAEVKEEYKLTANTAKQIEKKVAEEIKTVVERANSDYLIEKAHIDNALKEEIKKAEDEEKRETVKAQYQEKIEKAEKTYQEEVQKRVIETVEKKQKEIIETQERKIKNKTKTEVEEDVRGRLRGFARTIPSFIMAYGDDDLTLTNFDQYTPANVFQEVTGITVDQFLFLRDGGDYEEKGEQHHFTGKLFDEVVFNESVQEFLRKKAELDNYFEEKDEDIFDYIPPQKTNQIYTPKWVVKMMVDDLEKENPGIYDDPDKTFVDLYMKSGLYITEIVKRLYNSSVIKVVFPDDSERIKHILENQVYGFAPTEIIYKIATNFIFGNLDASISRDNFLQEDTVPYAKKGRLQDLINSSFGE